MTSALIVPNQVWVGWGAWTWGLDDVHMEMWGSAPEMAGRTPVPQEFEPCSRTSDMNKHFQKCISCTILS